MLRSEQVTTPPPEVGVEVHIGTVKDVPWTENMEPDDDVELETTPKEVVQILGFDPKESEDA